MRTILMGLGGTTLAASGLYMFSPFLSWFRRSSSSQVISDLDLRAVIVIYRHGARLPIRTKCPLPETVNYLVNFTKPPDGVSYPIAPYDPSQKTLEASSNVTEGVIKDTLPGGASPGELTTYGYYQCFGLGKLLKSRYLDEPAKPLVSSADEIYVRSSNITRNLQSTSALLSGMLSGLGDDEPKPMPILTRSAETEILYPNYNCASLRAFRTIGYHYWDRMLKMKDDVIDALEAIDADAESHSLLAFNDEITCRIALGLPHRFAYSDDVVRALSSAVAIVERRTTNGSADHDPERLRVTAGPILQLVRKSLSRVREGRSRHKLFLFAGHDTTLIPVLVALKQFDDSWPPFASHLEFELYCEKNSEKTPHKVQNAANSDVSRWWVRVVYNNTVLTLPGCDYRGLMPYKKFADFIAPICVTREEYRAACNMHVDKKDVIPGLVLIENF